MARTLHLSGISRFVGTSAVGLSLFGALSGCVGQDKYNALKLDRDGLAEQLAKSQSDGQAAQAQADSYKSQLAQLMNNGQGSSALASNLSAQLASLQTQYDDLNKRYADAMNRPVTMGAALPPALTSELQAFAQQNPDLVEFDANKGIVKFKSDVTFDAGDASLKPEAGPAIARFATILNSSAASGYELMVAGHTDNQRVSNPHTIAAGNKDNWYLSAHRAITVGDKLMADSVSPQRIAVCGYADQRPVASNTTPAGQRANRRVEVLILPTTVHGEAVTARDVIPAHASVVHKTSKAVLNKDSVSEGMNK